MGSNQHLSTQHTQALGTTGTDSKAPNPLRNSTNYGGGGIRPNSSSNALQKEDGDVTKLSMGPSVLD